MGMRKSGGVSERRSGLSPAYISDTGAKPVHPALTFRVLFKLIVKYRSRDENCYRNARMEFDLAIY